jgi:YidC/Oxa1 family membrane protein insertase
MSKPQPKPFNTFLQIALLGVTVFLGWQLIKGGFERAPDNRTTQEVYTELLADNENLRDVTASQNLNAYLGRLDTELNRGDLTLDDKQRLHLQAATVVAEAKYRAGLALRDSGRMTGAYHQMHHLPKELMESQAWNQPFTFNGQTIVPGELHDQIREDLSERLQQDPVMGFFPGYKFVDWLVQLSGAQPWISYWLAALFLAIIVRLIVFYPAHRTQMFFRQMGQLQPLVKEIQQQHKEEPQEAQIKVMALYKEYGINPAAGCLPVLLQMPLFLLVYQAMLQYQFEFTKGYFLWINPWTSEAVNGWTAPNLGERDYLIIIVYGISMIGATLLAPVTDPSNVRQQRLMSLGITLVFTVTLFFWPIPSAFVVYWVFTNILSTGQSLWGYRQPLPPLQKVNAPNGAVKPASGFMAKMLEAAEKQQQERLKEGGKNGKIVDTGVTKNPGTPKQHKKKKKRG